MFLTLNRITEKVVHEIFGRGRPGRQLDFGTDPDLNYCQI